MKLHDTICKNEEALEIVNLLKKDSGKTPRDVILALNLLAETNADNNERDSSITAAYTMVRYMSPEAEDIIAMLLITLTKKRVINQKYFYATFDKSSNADRYFKWTQSAIIEVQKNPSWIEEANLNKPEKQEIWTEASLTEHYVMLRVCNKMFHKLLTTMREHGIPDVSFLQDVYDMAYKAHFGVKRGTGEPYLNHPLQVAKTLVDIGVESTVVAAALLHDVVEDNSNYSFESLSKFGQRVVELVDCVTAVDNDFAKSKNSEEYSQDKAEMDYATFLKLKRKIEEKPANIFALYIKAADRIHNLRTIDDVESEKRYEKIDQTETEYLRLLKQYHINYFIPILEDLIWRISNRNLYNRIESKYNTLLSYSCEEIEETNILLQTSLAQDLLQMCKQNDVSRFKCEVKRNYHLPYAIHQIIKQAGDPRQIENYINKAFLPICDFDILLDPQGDDVNLDLFSTFFVKIFKRTFEETGRTIIDIEKDDRNRFILHVEDQYRNIMRYCFVLRSDYNEYMTGESYDLFSERTSATPDVSESDTITVFLKDDAEKKLPKGSTIIDLAFALHPQIGFSLKSASISGETVPIYTILRDKNKVILEADTFEIDGIPQRFIPHARIEWLAHVVTEDAKQELVKYLERKYEGDNPFSETKSKVSDSTFNTVLNELLADPILNAIVEEDK